ncbi:Hypothetical protein PHPALM_2825 [Phytophthora palmivora]|uniref:Uncharacterized protein n=1 Tax=Phytophthora palmivora TaxID=4796 RepID=A0A2P4YNX6_9STRA|nr:Hypothetical protein PHPALM_2825 [Phytophthora palmivora]
MQEPPYQFLNVAGLRARLKIKDDNAKDRREHVDHYIETLEDQDLADSVWNLVITLPRGAYTLLDTRELMRFSRNSLAETGPLPISSRGFTRYMK